MPQIRWLSQTLPAHFDSEAELWQYITSFWEADGRVHLRLSKQLTLGFHQSNKAYLLGLKAVCGPERDYHRRKELDDDPGQNGLHSNGEPRQSMHYHNEHAIRLMRKMAPYMVTKQQQVLLVEEYASLRTSLANTAAWQVLCDKMHAANHGVGALPVVQDNITQARHGGFFDGDGTVNLEINKDGKEAMRGRLRLGVCQPKCRAVLPAIANIFGGYWYEGSDDVIWGNRWVLPSITSGGHHGCLLRRRT